MPKKIFTEQEKEEIIRLYTITKIGAKSLAAKYNCSAPTLLKNLAEWGVQPNAKKLDLTNQYFGKLQAIKPAPKRNDKYTRWVCKCECGNEIEVRTDYLRNGHTTSCGCACGRVDIVGKVFGYLTVIQSLPGGKQLCQCKCGNVTEVLTYNLKNGNTQSCGCLQKERTSAATFIDLTGQKFGKLLVIERVENNRFGHVCYRCKCECGGETIVDATNLRNGNTSSCGCIKSKGEMIINNWLQKHDFDFRSQYSFNDCVLSTGRRPFFDFVLFKNDKPYLIIEYNGRQHYEITGGWNTEEAFEQTQRRDREKLQWCKDNHYPVLIIKYDEDIEKVLEGLVKATAEAPDMEEAEELIREVEAESAE